MQLDGSDGCTPDAPSLHRLIFKPFGRRSFSRSEIRSQGQDPRKEENYKKEKTKMNLTEGFISCQFDGRFDEQ
ncbi:hypothetical protein FJY90_00810 [Candidatus Gottesmanbacteria bacterium]|nr:hypothetical protein [Candidatus Gottesmanbacteria bacterium]